MTRHAGVLAPLFSIPSSASWGIGELPDIVPFSAWLARAGFDRLMLLPIGTMEAGQRSPYSAASAMAIDPVFVSMPAIEDFVHAGGVGRLSQASQQVAAEANTSRRVAYDQVRGAKQEAMVLAFEEFVRREWEQLTPRAGALAAYIARERWWLDDYALFQTLSEAHRPATWRGWPAGLRDREAQSLDDARRQFARRVLSYQYEQWIAEGQWQAARADALSHGVSIFGDLPFVVDLHSADVWARADEFLLDVSLGVPPDAFSETGQDWRLPTYRWPVIAAREYPWIRQRARRMAALFSGYRVDHLVGFYRTYGRPVDGSEAFFSPADEPAQQAQGEAVLRIFLDSGADIIAEDLGTVPDFVRESLARIGVAGCKVLRWERAWREPGQPFHDPASYPALSVVLSGTHDTETHAGWWDHAPLDERLMLLRLPSLRPLEIAATDPWSDRLRDALLETMYGAGSAELFLPLQDLFGWRDRINVPGTIDDRNWTWRLPWLVDRLGITPEAVERAAFCRGLAASTTRR